MTLVFSMAFCYVVESLFDEIDFGLWFDYNATSNHNSVRMSI